jgi:ABC-type sugar transport system permease subunit
MALLAETMATTPLAQAGERSSHRQRRRNYAFGLALLAPALLLYVCFVIYPLIRGAIVSLYRWDGLSTTMNWVGFSNYTNAIHDPIFLLSLRNTVQYAVGVTIAKNVLGLGLALLLNRKLRLRAFFRTSAFLPVMISFVVCGILWSWIFNPIFGLADQLLALLGFHNFPGWLSDPHLALWSVMWVDVWKWTGFHVVLFLAALQAVPQDLLDAASVDGASASARLRYVTLPSIRPVVALSVMLALTGAFVANYDVVYVMTGGGPLNATQVALTYIVQTAFSADEVGYANAMSMILFVIVAIIGAFQLRLMVRRMDAPKEAMA